VQNRNLLGSKLLAPGPNNLIQVPFRVWPQPSLLSAPDCKRNIRGGKEEGKKEGKCSNRGVGTERSRVSSPRLASVASDMRMMSFCWVRVCRDTSPIVKLRVVEGGVNKGAWFAQWDHYQVETVGRARAAFYPLNPVCPVSAKTLYCITHNDLLMSQSLSCRLAMPRTHSSSRSMCAALHAESEKDHLVTGHRFESWMHHSMCSISFC
jgi:hypothetical protein